MADASESYGPFVVTLEQAEIEAVAARYGRAVRPCAAA